MSNKSFFYHTVRRLVLPGICLAMASSCAAPAAAAVSTAQDIGKYGMIPVHLCDVVPGDYPIEVDSSSTKFRIVDAILHVTEDSMDAVITLSGTGYPYIYPGTVEEAEAADSSEYIPFAEDAEGMYTYAFPVSDLNAPLECAAYSKRKEIWYERQILFDASTLPEGALKVELPDYALIDKAVTKYLKDKDKKEKEDASSGTVSGEAETAVETVPADQAKPADETDLSEQYPGMTAGEPVIVEMEDGEYSIELAMTGGSGKSAVLSPTLMIVKEGYAYARLTWSSSSYDYMIVGGQKYMNEAEPEADSVFTIPILLMDEEIHLIADTTAMGTPHEISYTFTFYSESIGSKNALPQEAAKRVILLAAVIIIGGGILNDYVNKKNRA